MFACWLRLDGCGEIDPTFLYMLHSVSAIVSSGPSSLYILINIYINIFINIIYLCIIIIGA